ncbi:MAG TPA: rod shape-determining protein MreC [Acidimicrobiales bacterium]
MAVSRPTGSRTRLVVLVLASVTLLTFGVRDAPVIRQVREAASVVVDPLESAADSASRPFRNAWKGVTDYDDVERENQELRADLAEARAGEVRSTDAEHQLTELSEALDLPYAADVPTVAARVMSGPRSNFSHAVEIDKGTDDGIAEGMPVVTGAGLVGRISRASGSSATVELVTDPQYRVGIRLATTGDLGTARGRGRDEPLAVDTALAPDAEVDEGTGLVTSGVDRSAYPAGIPVGTVESTREGSGGLALELVVEPLVDVDRLSYVGVLRWEPGS